MHLGVETVALGGEGFEAHVAAGQSVAAGELLISFDMDLLARPGAEPDHPDHRHQWRGLRDRAARWRIALAEIGDPLMTLDRGHGRGLADAAPVGGDEADQDIVVMLAARHPRPPGGADRGRGQALRRRDGPGGQGDKRANARSPVAIMAMGVGRGDDADRHRLRRRRGGRPSRPWPT